MACDPMTFISHTLLTSSTLVELAELLGLRRDCCAHQNCNLYLNNLHLNNYTFVIDTFIAYTLIT